MKRLKKREEGGSGMDPWDSGGEMEGLQTRGVRVQGQRRDQPLKTVCLFQLHSQPLNSQDRRKLTAAATGQRWGLGWAGGAALKKMEQSSVSLRAC